jgi:hypothetical protein
MFPAPTAGWISNRNISTPESGVQGAAILDNFFPTATGAILRRGKSLYVQVGETTITSIFSYNAGINKRLFAANATTIYDITDSLAPVEVVTGKTNGYWSVVQFATTGGIFLIGVNGEDTGFVFDGTDFYDNVEGGVWEVPYDNETAPFVVGEVVTGAVSGATATVYRVEAARLLVTDITGGPFQDDEGLTGSLGGGAQVNGIAFSLIPGVTFDSGTSTSTTADMSYVWAYKSRLFFLEKETMNFWYLTSPDAIGGPADVFPLGADLGRGGSLIFGHGWSLDSGASGGLSEQCIFVSSEGEVAVYQGNDPAQAAQWSKVGVYRIGRPLGKDAFIRAGGDIIISTSIGKIPISQAIQRDFAALAPAAVSYPIEEAWRQAVDERGAEGWVAEMWQGGQMVVVAPPTASGTEPVVFVANAGTGAWGRYTNWNMKCAHSVEGDLYFGSPNGEVYRANIGGMDGDQTYTGVYMPLFEYLGSPASIKVGVIGRAVLRSRADVNEVIALHSDYDMNMESPPNAAPVPAGNTWGSAIWGQAKWGGSSPEIMNQDFHSIGGSGYTLSLSLQVTSGALTPIDTEIIRMEMVYNVAEIVT